MKIEDLSEELIRGTIRLGVERRRMPNLALTEPLDKVLGKLELLTDGVPNNAAAILFTTKPYRHPQLMMRMARFRGTEKLEFIDNQRAEGNFFELLDAGMAFCFKHLSLSGKVVGLRREEHLEVPIEALRETLVNALCHRQYERYNLTIGLAIYDDRVEIESPGIFPPQITPENIKHSHASIPYNRVLADVLYKTTFLENWGTGAKRIMDACREQGVEEPTWKADGAFVTVTFKRPEYASVPKRDTKDEPKVFTKEFTKEFTKASFDIYELISNDSHISIDMMSEQLHLSTRQVKKYLKRLQDAGKIARIGSRKIGEWKVVDIEFFNSLK